MNRRIAIFLICTAVLLVCTGCGSKYNQEDFIGNTCTQILEEYGAFDCCLMPPGEDGVYRNTACGYTSKEAQKGFLGTSSEIIFFISFDSEGIAVKCYEAARPGG